VKTFLVLVLLMLIGVGALASGVDDTFSEVTCKGHVMAPDELCSHTSKYGNRTENDYGAEERGQRVQGLVKLGLGTPFLLFPIATLLLYVRMRRRGGPAPHPVANSSCIRTSIGRAAGTMSPTSSRTRRQA
jgi:hypothetical protein